MSLVIGIAAFLIMICLLVAAHELGHYLSARKYKMGVEEFAIGFGPKLCTWMRRTYEADPAPDGTARFETTDFTFRVIPLGGFVRIKGMVPEEDGSETQIAGGFYSKPPIQRLAVLFAGPLFSLLFGIVVLTGVFSVFGEERHSTSTVVQAMSANGPAAKAGLKLGDKVLQIDDQPVNKFMDLVHYARERPGKTVTLQVDRNGRTLSLRTVIETSKTESPVFEFENGEYVPKGDSKIQGKLGLGFPTEHYAVPFGQAFARSVTAPFQMISGLASLVAQPSKAKEQVGGPIQIADITVRAAESGIVTLMTLAAMLSMSLGIMNLIPIPPLDGGQMAVAFVELLRKGRRLSSQVQGAVSTVGFLVVFTLIASVVVLDINRKRDELAQPAQPKMISNEK